MTKRHRWKNRGGTTTELSVPLALQRREASPIHRHKWHARKRKQTIMVPLKHDWDTLALQGAATREVQERRRKKPDHVITKGPLFDRINKIKRKEKE